MAHGGGIVGRAVFMLNGHNLDAEEIIWSDATGIRCACEVFKSKLPTPGNLSRDCYLDT